MKRASSTIKDVARLAGVSVATVSRILNDLPGYSEETKQTVMKAIEKLGYSPNAVARGLVVRETRTIGVLLPSVSSKFASQLLSGIEEAAHRRSHSVIVCNTNVDGRRTMEYLRVLREKRVDGVVFTSEFITEEYGKALRAMKVPVVLVSTFSDRFKFPHVRVDDHQASYFATRFMIEKGHRTIGMIAGTKSDQIAGVTRVSGFRQALIDGHVEYHDGLIAYGDFAYFSGIRGMEELIERVPGLTAVVAASDEMAVGALSYAFKHGIRVPEQVSVIGYDDTLDALMSIPPLTTVHQPIHEMGEKAIEMLLERKEENVIMPFHIVERDSVRSI